MAEILNYFTYFTQALEIADQLDCISKLSEE